MGRVGRANSTTVARWYEPSHRAALWALIIRLGPLLCLGLRRSIRHARAVVLVKLLQSHDVLTLLLASADGNRCAKQWWVEAPAVVLAPKQIEPSQEFDLPSRCLSEYLRERWDTEPIGFAHGPPTLAQSKLSNGQSKGFVEVQGVPVPIGVGILLV